MYFFQAYYGGEARCDAEVGENYDPTELVCGACSDVARAQMCPKHGTDFLEYKCRYCCSVAVFFCFGTTHFCNPCHDDFQRVTNLTKTELPHCPAGKLPSHCITMWKPSWLNNLVLSKYYINRKNHKLICSYRHEECEFNILSNQAQKQSNLMEKNVPCTWNILPPGKNLR